MAKSTKVSPIQKLLQSTSDFLVGFSILLIISGIIGTVFALQDLQDTTTTTQDIRSQASVTNDDRNFNEQASCPILDVCQTGALEGDMSSCVPQEVCTPPLGCYLTSIHCPTDICDTTQVVICPEKIDDIYYADITQLDSPRFYINKELSQEISESALREGSIYYYQVEVALQNEVKGITDLDTVSFFTGVRTNQVDKNTNKVLYSKLTRNSDEYRTQISGQFQAKRNNSMDFTIETIDNHGAVIIPESNFDNNKHQHTFSAQACTNNPDLNDDGLVDLRDFSILSRDFLKVGIQSKADINCDGKVTILDYAILAAHFSVTQ